MSTTEQEPSPPTRPAAKELLAAGAALCRRHAVFIGLLAVYLAATIATLQQYGLGTDEPKELFLGDRYLYLACTWDRRHLDFNQRTIPFYREADHPDFFAFAGYAKAHPMEYWPVGTTCASAAKQVFWRWLRLLDPIDAGRISTVLFGAGILTIVYAFGCLGYSRTVGLAAMLCLALAPRFWGHCHHNVKDIPSCFMMSLAILLFYLVVRRRDWRLIPAAAVATGVGLATKANAVTLPLIFGPWFLYVLWQRQRRREPLGLDRRTVAALLAAPVVAVLAMFILWPILWDASGDQLRTYVSYLLSRGGSGTPQWNHVPLLLTVITTPILIVLLTLLGIANETLEVVRRRKPKAEAVLLSLWAGIPLLRLSVPRAVLYDGVRLYLEAFPALALFAGIGFDRLLHIATSRWPRLAERLGDGLKKDLLPVVVIPLLLSPVILWQVRHHPLQATYFNAAVGGLAGANELDLPDPTD